MKSEEINLIKLTEDLNNLIPKPKVRDVFIIANKPGSPRVKTVAQIYPFLGRSIEIDLDKNYQAKSDPTFLRPYFGKRKGPIFEPEGKTILLKPNFEFVEDVGI